MAASSPSSSSSSAKKAAQVVRSQQRRLSSHAAFLFSTSFPQTGLELKDIHRTDSYVLRNFRIKNRSAGRLLVRLQSSLPSAVAFQPSNANLGATSDNFNQLFNLVEHIDAVTLLPGESRQLVLSFHPLRALEEQSNVPSAAGADRGKFDTVKGAIFFVDGETGNAMSVPFVAHVCESVIEADVADIFLEPPVLAGHTFLKDITVWNRSEIATSFHLRTSRLADDTAACVFTFMDIDTGRSLAGSGAIKLAAFSHVRVRISAKPMRPGLVSETLFIENDNNEDNVEQIAIQGSVVSDREADVSLLVMSPDDTSHALGRLNFGNCFAGVPIRSVIVLRNISQHVLDVSLGSTLPDENGAVIFDLASKKDDGEGDDDDEEDDDDDEEDNELQGRRQAQTNGGDSSDKKKKKKKKKDDQNSEDPQEKVAAMTRAEWVRQAAKDRVEEVTLAPGAEKVLTVSYRPELNADDDDDDGGSGGDHSDDSGTIGNSDVQLRADEQQFVKLRKIKFHLVFGLTRSGVSSPKALLGGEDGKGLDDDEEEGGAARVQTLPVVSRVCLSVIKLSTTVVNFGDCSIGSRKTVTVHVANFSDLPTSIRVSYKSKCVRCLNSDEKDDGDDDDDKNTTATSNSNGDHVHENGPFVIPARGVLPLRFEFIPRRVNPDYCKQITIINTGSAQSDQFLLIRANNIDTHGVWFHSLFYKLTIPTARTSHYNALDFKNMVANCPAVRRFTITNVTTQLLELYLESPDSSAVRLFQPTDKDLDKLEELLAVVTTESHDPARAIADEGEFVEARLKHIREIERAEREWLAPLDRLRLMAGEARTVVVIIRPLQPSHATSQKDQLLQWQQQTHSLHNFSSTLNVHIVSCDESLWAAPWFEPRGDDESMPVRAIHVQGKVCNSVMEIGQTHINFGVLSDMRKFDRAIVISNPCDVPLLYKIEQSRSIASNDVKFLRNTSGVIMPFANHEVPFVFKPSFAGVFLEKLTVRNVLDHTDNRTVLIKANLLKKETFWLKNLKINFGTALVSERSRSKRIVIKNISSKTREFKISLAPAFDSSDSEDDPCIRPRVRFTLERVALAPTLSAIERDEQIEHLRRKLKIAVRKGKKEKITTLDKKLSALLAERKQEQSLEADPEDDGAAQSGDATHTNKVTFTLESNAIQHIRVTFHPDEKSSSSRLPDAPRVITGCLHVHESSNKDIVKDIIFSVVVCYDHDMLVNAMREDGKGASARASLSASRNASPVRRSRMPWRSATLSAGTDEDPSPSATSTASTATTATTTTGVFTFGAVGTTRRPSSGLDGVPQPAPPFLRVSDVPMCGGGALTPVAGGAPSIFGVFVPPAMQDPLDPECVLLLPRKTEPLVLRLTTEWMGTEIVPLKVRFQWLEHRRNNGLIRMRVVNSARTDDLVDGGDEGDENGAAGDSSSDNIFAVVSIMPRTVVELHIFWTGGLSAEPFANPHGQHARITLSSGHFPALSTGVSVRCVPLPSLIELGPPLVGTDVIDVCSHDDDRSADNNDDTTSETKMKKKTAMEQTRSRPSSQSTRLRTTIRVTGGTNALTPPISTLMLTLPPVVVAATLDGEPLGSPPIVQLAHDREAELAVSVATHSHGYREWDIGVRDLTFATTASVRLCVTSRVTPSLFFVHTEPSGAGVAGVLDAGCCYLDPAEPSRARLLPFHMRNVRKVPILVAVESTLPHQVQLLLPDHKPVDDFLRLQPDQTIETCISVTPRLTRDARVRVRSRELMCGLKFRVWCVHVTDPRAEPLLTTEVARVKAVIGQSAMHVSVPSNHAMPGKPHDVELHTISASGRSVKGSFSLSNLSDRLPLHFSITAADDVVLSVTRGVIAGIDEVVDVDFAVTPMSSGFFERAMAVHNTNNGADTHTLRVTLFVDPHHVVTTVSAKMVDEDELRYTRILDFGDMYVAPSTELPFVPSHARRPIDLVSPNSSSSPPTPAALWRSDTVRERARYQRRLERAVVGRARANLPFFDARRPIRDVVRNMQARFLDSQPRASVHFSATSHPTMSFEVTNPSHADTLQLEAVSDLPARTTCEPELRPGSSTTVSVTLDYAAEMTAKDAEALVRGERVLFFGRLLLRQSPDDVLFLAHLKAHACLSRFTMKAAGEAKTNNKHSNNNHIDAADDDCDDDDVKDDEEEEENDDETLQLEHVVELGTIGYADNWNDILVECRLRNMSRYVPLHFKVDCSTLPESVFVDVPDDDDDGLLDGHDRHSNDYKMRHDSVASLDVFELHKHTRPADGIVRGTTGPSETAYVCVVLCTEQMGLGPFSYRVTFVNDRNPHNAQTLILKGVVRDSGLVLSRLSSHMLTDTVADTEEVSAAERVRRSGFEERSLMLPVLSVPTPIDHAPSAEWFTIENTSSEPMELELTLDLEACVDRLLSVDVVSRMSSAPIRNSTITLSGGQALDLRVVLSVTGDLNDPSLSSMPVLYPQLSLSNPSTSHSLPHTGNPSGAVTPIDSTTAPGSGNSPKTPHTSPILSPTLAGHHHDQDELERHRQQQQEEKQRRMSSALSSIVIPLSTSVPLTLTVARLYITSPSLRKREKVLIKAPLIQEASFSVSPERLELTSSTLTTSVRLTNESERRVIVFRALQHPHLTVEPQTGSIEPGDSVTVRVGLLVAHVPSTDEVLEDVVFADEGLPGAAPQRVAVAVTTPRDYRRGQVPSPLDTSSASVVLGPGDSIGPTVQVPELTAATSGAAAAGGIVHDETKFPAGVADAGVGGGAVLGRVEPKLVLKRATAISEAVYEIRVGQQDYNSGNVVWSVSVESLTPTTPMAFSLEVVTGQHDGQEELEPVEGDEDDDVEDDDEERDDDEDEAGPVPWLSLSRTEGELTENEPTVSVDLVLSTSTMGVFSSYVMLRNLSNPTNVITVRVQMTVVASANAAVLGGNSDDTNEYFRVTVDSGIHRSIEVVDGDDKKPSDRRRQSKKVISIPHAYVSHLQQNRNFLITNVSRVPLQFVLSKVMEPDDRSEVYLSLSNYTLKLFDHLYIEAGHSVRIFLHFVPQVPALAVASLNALREENQSRRLTPHTVLALNEPVGMGLSQPASDAVWKTFHIKINCLLIKDYQQVVTVDARCRPPQMELSTLDVVFLSSETDGGAVNRARRIGSVDEEDELDYDDDDDDDDDGDERKKQDKSFFPFYQDIVVTNLYETQLTFFVRNDSHFFSHDVLSAGELGATPSTPRNSGSSTRLSRDETVTQGRLRPSPSIPTRFNRLGTAASALAAAAFSPLSADEEAALVSLKRKKKGDDDEEMENQNLAVTVMPGRRCVVRVHPNAARLRELPSAWAHVEEHITFYNKRQMTEKYHVAVRVTSMELRLFRDPGPTSRWPADRLERHVGKWVSNFETLFGRLLAAVGGWSLETVRGLARVTSSSQYEDVYIELRCLTDSLLFYALKGRVGQFVFPIATWLYTVIDSHPLFPKLRELLRQATQQPSLRVDDDKSHDDDLVQVQLLGVRWMQQVSFFLSHFPPNKYPMLSALDVRAYRHCKRILALVNRVFTGGSSSPT